MTKPVVFVSHITAEGEVAQLFKNLVSAHFLGLIDVFVSSDGQTISMGQRWLDSITKALNDCVIEIVVASPESVTRPWVNFEAGAGWVRNIPVIPLCHSGLVPSALPVPLNLLQSARATDQADLKRIFDVLAKALGGTTPTVDFSKFIADVAAFEKQYTFWKACNAAFDVLQRALPGLVAALIGGQDVEIELNDKQIAIIEPHANFLGTHSILTFNPRTAVSVGPTGNIYRSEFFRGTKFSATVSDTSFKKPY